MKPLTIPDPDLRRVYNKVFYGEHAEGGEPVASVTEAVIGAVQGLASELDRHPYCEVHIEVQDGRPVMVRVTSKHKPGKAANA